MGEIRVCDRWLLEVIAGISTEIGVCFTSQMLGPRGRVDCFIALVRLKGAPKRLNKTLESFAEDVRNLGECRNRAIHDVWKLDDASKPHRIEMTARRSPRTLQIHVPTRELLDLEVHIAELEAKLHEIASEIWKEITPEETAL
jgi:hypothetical protein